MTLAATGALNFSGQAPHTDEVHTGAAFILPSARNEYFPLSSPVLWRCRTRVTHTLLLLRNDFVDVISHEQLLDRPSPLRLELHPQCRPHTGTLCSNSHCHAYDLNTDGGREFVAQAETPVSVSVGVRVSAVFAVGGHASPFLAKGGLQ